MLYGFGVGEVPISISGDPARRDRLVHTVRAVGAMTRRDLRASSPATSSACAGRYGTAWPIEAAEGSDVVVVAGGLGLAPLRPASTQLWPARRATAGSSLLYGARSPRDLLYRRARALALAARQSSSRSPSIAPRRLARARRRGDDAARRGAASTREHDRRPSSADRR